jgi:hypothetical protein
MIRTRLFAIAMTAAVVLLADSALARVNVKIDFDKNFDFKSVKTWRSIQPATARSRWRGRRRMIRTPPRPSPSRSSSTR